MKQSKKLIKKALEVLGKKNFVLIVHGGSFPSIPEEDTGFGTPNSSGAKQLIEFVSGVFNGIQLGPAGKTKQCDSSPYTSTVFSNNPLFVDLKTLTENEWGNILPTEVFNKIVEENPNKNRAKTAYSYIYERQLQALKVAFGNFKKSELAKLKSDFETFKSENSFWLDNDALYEALSAEYDNDYWPKWPNAEPFLPEAESKRAEFLEHIEFYSFCQFVVYVQNQKTIEFAASHDIKLLADRQVAFSDRDIWAYQSMFLRGWQLGCPPDYFSKNGQAWGFPVLDPEKLFNSDGSLGEAGLMLKELYKKMFRENPGGIRIDHIVGLIDPWVYKKGKSPTIEQGASRLFSSPEHPDLSRFAIANKDDVNCEFAPDKECRVQSLTNVQVAQYGAMLEKIILQAAKENGIEKDCIICEDLGTLTYPVERVMKQLDLLGMRLTQFVAPELEEHPYRCCNIPKRSWVMTGTHDNEPISIWAKKIVHTDIGNLHAENLCKDIFSNLNDSEQEMIKHKLRTDDKFLAFAKMVELFACESENIQMFFTDFFGIEETYNVPGSSGDENWSLRISPAFEELYFRNLEQGKGLNLIKVLKTAIESRGNEFSSRHAGLLEELESLIQSKDCCYN